MVSGRRPEGGPEVRAAARPVVRWLDEEERAAWQGLMQMELQLSGALGRQLYQESRLSLQDYSVLVCLTEQPEGRMRAFELGRQLGWEKSRLSHHISRMAGRGLVERQQCPSDQRGSFVVVTDEGRAVIEAAAPGHVAAVRRHFVDLLSRTQLAQLTAITSTVLSALEAECQSLVCDEEVDEPAGEA
jgi:DNA-binding MarR family transcriptional regulator